jgi:hypothetical protein
MWQCELFMSVAANYAAQGRSDRESLESRKSQGHSSGAFGYDNVFDVVPCYKP